MIARRHMLLGSAAALAAGSIDGVSQTRLQEPPPGPPPT